MKIIKIFRLILTAFMIGFSCILPVPPKDGKPKHMVEQKDPKDGKRDE